MTFSDGTTIRPSSNEIVVIVGPNNSGKTSTLRGISRFAEKGRAPLPLKNVSFSFPTDDALAVKWMDTHLTRTEEHGQLRFKWIGKEIDASEFYINNVLRRRARQDAGFEKFSHAFVQFDGADSRLSVTQESRSFDVERGSPESPVHVLMLNEALERTLSMDMYEAFGLEMSLNRAGGDVIRIHVGESLPHPAEGEDRAARSFLNRLSGYPTLAHQGDGVRGFVGTLLLLLSSPSSIQLIDEPEMLLHPPQALHLGKLLVERAPSTKQLFIATHSAHLLRGILDKGSSRVRLVRLSRSGTQCSAKSLSNEELREIMIDPLIRHSQALDSLFFSLTVICEADADCRFFSAVSESLPQESYPDIARDALFIPVYGKSRIAKVARSLNRLSVVVRVVVDIDALDSEETMNSLVSSLGGEWSLYRDRWNRVKKGVESSYPLLKKNQVREKILGILGDVHDNISSRDADRIREELRYTSPWKLAKKTGFNLLSPQTYNDAVALLDELAEVGIYIVPRGELEAFDRGASGHGPAWVSEVLQRDLATDPALEEARQFTAKVVSSLHASER